MAMVSMKVEEEHTHATPAVSPYGYGLCIYLNEEQVEALGLKANPPAAGASVGIRAIAVVVSKTEDADLDGDGDGVDVRLSLQITDMEVTPGAQSSNQANLLYGGTD